MKAENAVGALLKKLQRESRAVTIIGELGPIQISLFETLLRHAWSHLLLEEIHEIPFAMLANEVGLDPTAQNEMKSVLKAALCITIETRLPNGDFRLNKLLSEVQIKNESIHFSFTPFLREQVRGDFV